MARRPLRDMTNRIGSEKDTGSTPDPVLRSAHSRLSKALKEANDLMPVAYGLFCVNPMSSIEVGKMTSAMVDMADRLEEWHGFFKQVAERSCANDALLDLNADSECVSGDNASLDCDDSGISGSPLVPCKTRTVDLFPLTPLRRPSKVPKKKSTVAPVAAAKAISIVKSKVPVSTRPGPVPELHPGSAKLDHDLSHPAAPKPTSPEFPKVDHVERNLYSTPHGSSKVETSSNLMQRRKPSNLRDKNWSVDSPSPIGDRFNSRESPESMELVTPRPPKFQSRRRPSIPTPEEVWHDNSSMTSMPETPVQCSSPKACGKLLEGGSFDGLSRSNILTPVCGGNDVLTPACSRSSMATPFGAPSEMSTPYGTPGSALRPLTPFSISRPSERLVDDMTASAIQRMGVKGLEDELWRKLKAWHIDTHLGGPYARLRSGGLPLARNHNVGRMNNV